MDGFTKTPKMQCFKEGGSVQKQVKDFTRRDRKTVDEADIAQDKKIVKKAIGMHDEQQHEEKTDLSRLKKGGRIKKEAGTVKKFEKASGEYGAKKTATDLKNIKEAKQFKPVKKCYGGTVKKMADGGSVLDTIKGAATKLKENILGTEEQNKTAQENLDKQAAKGSKLAKFFGGKADAESAPVAKKRGGKC